MKKLLLNNWQAKLVSFVIAVAIWVYLRNLVDPSFLDRLVTGTFTPGR
jgi:YbbR domain-containing protein